MSGMAGYKRLEDYGIIGNLAKCALVGKDGSVLVEDMRYGSQSIRQSGCKDMVVQADVSKEDDVVQMFAQILEEWKRLDIQVNKAGIQFLSATHETALVDFEKVLAVNLMGRVGSPVEIATVFPFLASDDASHIIA